MATSYVAKREISWREMMALKATQLPRVISDSRMTKKKTMITAITGTFRRS